MPIYAYKGIDSRGKEVKGNVDLENHRLLRQHLKGKGVFLKEFREADAKGRRGFGRTGKKSQSADGGVMGKELRFGSLFGSVKPIHVAEATRHMATLVGASIQVTEALQAVVTQIENTRLKSVLSQVRTAVMEGASFTDALAQHPKVFPKLYVNMVRAGESSGTLDVVLNRLADLLDDQVKLRAKVTAAMTYPLVMAVVGGLVVGMLMIMVVPKFEVMFEQLDAQLPLPTRLMIGLSKFLSSWWWLMILSIVASVLLFQNWKQTESGERAWHRFILNRAFVGTLMRQIALARFCRTFGTLLRSGVPLLTALEIVKAIIGNRILEEVIDQALIEVREGQSLAVPLRASGEFPPMICQMIDIGEQSGTLEEMLIKAADAYEIQVDSKLSALTALLEPLMIVIMGGFVGVVVGSILLPILDMSKAFQGAR
ncbi:MAG: type II secretion system protein GspF [Myxococcales bacterium]|nr:type II secretion system protein GspF [Myxococcales bacterium]|tara:strand:+ start:408 stop:1688 length:1281 start_codon:yes stop_codon:yes gene_type:complete